MGLFFNKKRDEEIEQLNLTVNSHVNKMQDSLQRFGQWIQYLSRKDQYQDYQIQQLERELERQGISKEKIRDIIQAKYQYHYITERIKELDHLRHENEQLKAKINDLEALKLQYLDVYKKAQEVDVVKEYYSLLAAKMKELDEKIEKKQQVQIVPERAAEKPSLRERIIRKFTQNSKDYTRTFILNLIQKYGEINALQLREIAVEEQGICSKSSFYRALEELEESKQVFVEKTGKENKYKAVHVLQ